MSENVTFNGEQHTIPSPREKGWGAAVTAFIIEVAEHALTTALTLAAEMDLGATYGIRAKWFRSKTSNPAAAGAVRLARADSVSWRNQADGADLGLGPGADNLLEFGGVDLVDASTAQTLTNKTLTAPAVSAPAFSGAATGSLSGLALTSPTLTTPAFSGTPTGTLGFVSSAAVTLNTAGGLWAPVAGKTPTMYLTATGMVYFRGAAEKGDATGSVAPLLAGGIPAAYRPATTVNGCVHKYTGSSSAEPFTINVNGSMTIANSMTTVGHQLYFDICWPVGT